MPTSPAICSLAAPTLLLAFLLHTEAVQQPTPPPSPGVQILSVNGEAPLPYDNHSPLDIGIGYDSLTLEARGACLENASKANLPKYSNIFTTRTSIDTHNTTEELFDSLTFNTAVAFNTGAYSASASVAYVKTDRVHRYAEYAELVTDIEGLKRVLSPRETLTPEASEACKKGSETFKEMCGDRYVAGQVDGAVFRALMSAEASSEEQQRSLRADFQGAAGPVSATVATTAMLTHLHDTYHLNISYVSEGPLGTPSQLSIERLVDYAVTGLRRSLGRNLDKQWPKLWITRSYSSCRPALSPRQEQFYAFELNELRTLYLRHAALQYIASHPDQFGDIGQYQGFSRPHLQREQEAVSSEIQTIQAVAKQCDSDDQKCIVRPPLQHPSNPERAGGWHTIDPRDNRPAFIGEAFMGERKIAQVIGSWWSHCDSLADESTCRNKVTAGESDMWTLTSSSSPTAYAHGKTRFAFSGPTQVFFRVCDKKTTQKNDYLDNGIVGSDVMRARVFTPVYIEDFEDLQASSEPYCKD